MVTTSVSNKALGHMWGVRDKGAIQLAKSEKLTKMLEHDDCKPSRRWLKRLLKPTSSAISLPKLLTDSLEFSELGIPSSRDMSTVDRKRNSSSWGSRSVTGLSDNGEERAEDVWDVHEATKVGWTERALPFCVGLATATATRWRCLMHISKRQRTLDWPWLNWEHFERLSNLHEGLSTHFY